MEYVTLNALAEEINCTPGTMKQTLQANNIKIHRVKTEGKMVETVTKDDADELSNAWIEGIAKKWRAETPTAAHAAYAALLVLEDVLQNEGTHHEADDFGEYAISVIRIALLNRDMSS